MSLGVLQFNLSVLLKNDLEPEAFGTWFSKQQHGTSNTHKHIGPRKKHAFKRHDGKMAST